MDEDLNNTFHVLAEQAFPHSLEAGKEISIGPNQESTILFGRNPKNDGCEGICMDDGARKSVAGLEAYKRYCSFNNTRIDLHPSRETFKLGAGIYKSLGTTLIRFPVDKSGNFLEYETDVINVDTPILFGLDKMKLHKWYFIN